MGLAPEAETVSMTLHSREPACHHGGPMSLDLRLDTSRLILAVARNEDLRAEQLDRSHQQQERLAGALEAVIPAEWPPEAHDRQVVEWVLGQLAHADEPSGWFLWYILQRAERTGRPVAMGIAAFKGPPDPAGTVELGYTILPGFRGHGYATEAVSALVGWAFSHRAVSQVLVDVRPHMTASIRVAEKCGFQLLGEGSSSGLRYARRREGAATREPTN